MNAPIMSPDSPQPWDALHRASCIVAFVAEWLLRSDEPLPGETLKAAEVLILSALDKIERQESNGGAA